MRGSGKSLSVGRSVLLLPLAVIVLQRLRRLPP